MITKPINSRTPGLALGLLAFAATLLAGCASTSVKRVDAEPAERAEREIPTSQLLNVNIAVFDSGVPDDPQAREEAQLFPEVRRAEARFLPVNLRDTLQSTGFWGAVRVVPEATGDSELLVNGAIRHSDGRVLELAITAVDATGRSWLDKTYSGEAAGFSYAPQGPEGDAFQGVYNRIADDLLAARRDLSASDLLAIQRVSGLRFGSRLAPEAFAAYLAENDGRYRVEGLPAEGDPTAARVEQIRDRDYAVIDALDQHYRSFHDQIAPAYNDWRAASLQEAKNLSELRRQSLTRKLLGALAVVGGIVGAASSNSSVGSVASQGAILGGAVLVASGFSKGSESQIHAQALEELGKSLESDVAPRNVQLQNQTVTLSGSAEAQFEEWQQLLQQIYATETGFVPEQSAAGQPAAVPQDR